jgi:hypothetical protein
MHFVDGIGRDLYVGVLAWMSKGKIGHQRGWGAPGMCWRAP